MIAFTNYLEKFGSHFLVAAMIPSLGLVIACMIVFNPILRITESFQIEQGIYSLIGVGLLVFVPTVLIGFTLTALNTYILKVFEGYVFVHRLSFLQKGHNRKATKLHGKIEKLRAEIEELESKKRKSQDDKRLLEELRTDYYIKAAEYDTRYPPLQAGIMPTEFGNILKASEAYSGTRYGIDAVQFWPRLLQVIPPNYKQSIEDARNELSFLVNMSALSVFFYLLCLAAVFVNFATAQDPNLSLIIGNSIRYIIAGLLAMVSNIFFYKAALFSVGDFGSMIRSAYDLFRLELLSQFRIHHPKNSIEEFKIWRNLGELFVLGQASMEYKPIKYEIKKDAKL